MKNLEIFIVTYNRSAYIKRTLDFLYNSVFRDYDITVLNNCSTDDTVEVLEKLKGDFSSLKVITHKNNIGVCANIARATELSNGLYTWVLCDDDDLDFSDVSDVLHVLNEGKVNLIHVGAHPDIEWHLGGMSLTPKQLLDKGYHYFKAASFLPCNIFKTERYQKNFLIPGYDNLVNGYPHMPYLYDIYEQDEVVYLSKIQIATARTVGQSYNLDKWFFWWLNTSRLLKSKEDVRLAFFDHFDDNELKYLYSLMAGFAIKNEVAYTAISGFVNLYFNGAERSGFFSAYRKLKTRKMLSSLKQKLKGSTKQ